MVYQKPRGLDTPYCLQESYRVLFLNVLFCLTSFCLMSFLVCCLTWQIICNFAGKPILLKQKR